MTQVRLMDRVRNTIRALHYSRKTEQSYCYWIRFFIRFHKCQHPRQLTARDIPQFLTWPTARHGGVSGITSAYFFALEQITRY